MLIEHNTENTREENAPRLPTPLAAPRIIWSAEVSGGYDLEVGGAWGSDTGACTPSITCVGPQAQHPMTLRRATAVAEGGEEKQ